MSEITISLTAGQIQKVVREAGCAGVPAAVSIALLPLSELDNQLTALASSPEYSSTLTRALRVLVAVPAESTALKTIALAAELSPPVTHRYLRTWVAVGAVQRDAASRRYRRTPSLG